MPAGRTFCLFVAVCVCAQGLTSAALKPLEVYPTPPGQAPDTQGARDTAYYLSTAAVEQAMIARSTASDGAPGLGEAALRADGPGHVPQWGRFEVAVAHRRTYANPFTDVTLDVTFTRPDSSTVAFWGFYDGEGMWRIRTLADQAGTWRYLARFSDGSGQFSGTFTCLESDLEGMIGVCEGNPIWFARKGGKPVLVRSIQVGERFGAGDEYMRRERAMFLDWAQSQGYNMVSWTVAARSQSAAALWDADGQQPDLAAYRRLEQMLDDLAARRMLVYPASGFFDLPSARRDSYLRYTLARLGSYPHVIWGLGRPSRLTAAEIDRLGRDIRAMDPFGHVLCVSNVPAADILADADWASCRVMQGPRIANLSRLNRVLLRDRSLSQPLYVRQALWSDDRYSTDELRKRAYVLMMSAATISVADTGSGPSFPLSARMQARHDTVKRVWDFFEQVPFWRMRPRQDLVDNGYCLAQPGRTYLVYLEGRGTVTVDIAEGMYRVKWINARDTDDLREAGIIAGPRSLTSPYEQDDWLLSLTRVEIVAGRIQPY